MYHAAQIMFNTSSLHFGHTVVLMDKWTPEGTLERVDKYKVTTSHLVPTMFHRLLALPEEDKAKYDVSSWTNVVHAAAPCPVPTKQSDVRLVGAVHLRVLRSDGRRRHDGEAAGVARQARHGRSAVAHVRDQDLTTTATCSPRGRREPCGSNRRGPRSSSTTRTRRRLRLVEGRVLHRRRHRLPGLRRLAVPVRPEST